MKFNLKKTVLKKHPIFGESFEVSFTDENDFKNEAIVNAPYTSLIIGPNGTGKSYLLKEIAEIFIHLKDIKEKSELANYHRLFEITFNINSADFIVSNFFIEKEKIKRTKTTVYQSSEEISPEKLILPETILVSSLLINDKFTVKNNYEDFYRYLGVRSIKTPSIAGTKSYIKRTLDLIFMNLNHDEAIIINKIKSLLQFLNYENNFRINYKLRYKNYFFNQPLNAEKFDRLFNNFNDPQKGFSNRKDSEFIPFGVRYYHNHIKNNSELKLQIIELINYIRENFNGNLSFDIINQNLPKNYYILLNHLNSLDLISYPELSLSKQGTNLGVNDISSGEYHILTSFIGIYASIQPNSLILIDEPEISLHPNWQMRYVSFLKELFKEYQNCHFLITSHSHFFASDLDGRHSKIIGLRRDIKDKIEKVDLPKDLNTFGWSAEEILLKVFKVNTSRNYFVADKLGELLDYISDQDSDERSIRDKFYELGIDKLSSLSDNDPLKVVYNTIVKEYVSNQSE
ncbi:AAA family ATPase [Flavobacterium sp. XGLA_31]|uniref:AAA family ATPase n=1 Tax=Flavobacterium sp. XGLA_31 TaxID=3447666 RepID=UPI003F377007